MLYTLFKNKLYKLHNYSELYIYYNGDHEQSPLQLYYHNFSDLSL